MNSTETPYWVTQDKRRIKIKDMDTNHIINTIKMLWNHTAPEEWRLKPYRVYKIKMTKQYVMVCLQAMVEELRNRELSRDQKSILLHIRSYYLEHENGNAFLPYL